MLLIEDESPIRQMLAGLLNDAGYAVLDAGDGLEALQIVRDDRPDLVVLDLMLPRMNGWQCLEQSREHLDSANIPVLIVSAVAGHGAHPISLGVAVWLTKPVDFVERRAILPIDFDPFLVAVGSLAGPALRSPHSLSIAPLQVIRRVLVVEDEHPIRNLLVDYLREEGYAVDAASSIREARRRIQASRPDLVLLDLMLPEESGWDLLRERSSDPALASMHLFALSAAPRDLLLQAKDSGADAFLSKSSNEDVLSAMIQSFVG